MKEISVHVTDIAQTSNFNRLKPIGYIMYHQV